MDATPDWNLYRAFLAVIDSGSLSGAARIIGVAQPTVGRQIEALEQSLGTPLFTRSPSGFQPTHAALALAPHARAMASAAETLVRTATGAREDARGVVRITASDIVGAEVLPPILTAWREAWPKVDIELVISNRLEDLLRRDADIAVRMARPTQGALFARRIGEMRLVFYAHRSYLQKHGVPRTMDDLAAHTLIGYDRIGPPPSAVAQLDREVSRQTFAVRTDSELTQLAALRAGLGVCPCQPNIAGRDPNLVPLLEREFGFNLEMWVVMHEDLKADRRMRALFDHLVVHLKVYAESEEAA